MATLPLSHTELMTVHMKKKMILIINLKKNHPIWCGSFGVSPSQFMGQCITPEWLQERGYDTQPW